MRKRAHADAGVHLNNQFIGTGYNKDIRMLGDFGSSLYTVEATDRKATRQNDIFKLLIQIHS